MENKAFLRRFLKTDYYTIGKLQLFNAGNKMIYECYTMELPYNDNQHAISCIPAGSYEVISNISPKFGEGYLVKNVINRSSILFHTGNYPRDTHGCLLVADNYDLKNPYENSSLINSKRAMNRLLSLNVKNFTLKITELC
ncbi:DUF5675 family protein [Flavobacterium psychrophilum]|uniref:DUF5675 family protein n=1 Tax=Flavobacterium psychrophilum TaxID=96345 RepID=UPI002D133314|nr:DUF5675 family protein [Flavobacterium psychrophilum]